MLFVSVLFFTLILIFVSEWNEMETRSKCDIINGNDYSIVLYVFSSLWYTFKIKLKNNNSLNLSQFQYNIRISIINTFKY